MGMDAFRVLVFFCHPFNSTEAFFVAFFNSASSRLLPWVGGLHKLPCFLLLLLLFFFSVCSFLSVILPQYPPTCSSQTGACAVESGCGAQKNWLALASVPRPACCLPDRRLVSSPGTEDVENGGGIPLACSNKTPGPSHSSPV